MRTLSFAMLILLIGLSGCARPPSAPAGAGQAAPGSGAEQPTQESPSRTLTMTVRYETNALAPKAVTGLGVNATLRLFNASLFYIDGSGAPHPYLADALPQLNTDSWRVLPDGKMEVTYKLRQGLAWHDGERLTAEDFAFAHRAYTMPGLGLFTSRPQNLMGRVEVRDPQTFVIHWRQPYPDAANFRPGELEALPRHILAEPLKEFEQDPTSQKESFHNLPFWTQEYIGAGPFRLENWVPGTELEGVAFDKHALGRPKIDRVIVRIMGDENTVLSNMLSEAVDLSTDLTLRYEHAKVLLGEWESSKRGVVVMQRGTFNYTIVQSRAEYQKTPSLFDVRVRRALAHAIDRDGMNDALFDGRGFTTETNIPQDFPYYSALERSIRRYPHDPRRAGQLMEEAGFIKDASGFFQSAAGERFKPDFWSIQSPQFERQQALMAETWARVGLDTNLRVMSPSQLRNFESAVTFSGLSARLTGAGERSLAMFTSAQIGSPANRWLGSNRGGWNSPEYDRLFEAYNTTLDRAERNQLVIEMMKLTSEELPVLPLYFNIVVLAHLSKVRGPAGGNLDSLPLWNVYEWELQ